MTPKGLDLYFRMDSTSPNKDIRHVLNLMYLFEQYHYHLFGERFSDINWQFQHYGPAPYEADRKDWV